MQLLHYSARSLGIALLFSLFPGMLQATTPGKEPPGRLFMVARGTASYYADYFHGRLTANGERFNMHELTAAHKTLPFGSMVRVTNLENGRTVMVRINDRGPYIDGRIIDLSLRAARELSLEHHGIGRVLLEAYHEPRYSFSRATETTGSFPSRLITLTTMGAQQTSQSSTNSSGTGSEQSSTRTFSAPQ